MSPLYYPWENRQIIDDSFPPCFSPISLELDVFVLILKVHYWKENIGHPPCYCLVNFGSELRQSSFQLHFVQILASWCQTKQARKIKTHSKLDLVGGQSPDYLVFPKVENTFQGGISVAATICSPLVGKCLATR